MGNIQLTVKQRVKHMQRLLMINVAFGWQTRIRGRSMTMGSRTRARGYFSARIYDYSLVTIAVTIGLLRCRDLLLDDGEVPLRLVDFDRGLQYREQAVFRRGVLLSSLLSLLSGTTSLWPRSGNQGRRQSIESQHIVLYGINLNHLQCPPLPSHNYVVE